MGDLQFLQKKGSVHGLSCGSGESSCYGQVLDPALWYKRPVLSYLVTSCARVTTAPGIKPGCVGPFVSHIPREVHIPTHVVLYLSSQESVLYIKFDRRMAVVRVRGPGRSQIAEKEVHVPDELIFRSSILQDALSVARESSGNTLLLSKGGWSQYFCAWLKTALPCASSWASQQWTTRDLIKGLKV